MEKSASFLFSCLSAFSRTTGKISNLHVRTPENTLLMSVTAQETKLPHNNVEYPSLVAIEFIHISVLTAISVNVHLLFTVVVGGNIPINEVMSGRKPAFSMTSQLALLGGNFNCLRSESCKIMFDMLVSDATRRTYAYGGGQNHIINISIDMIHYLAANTLPGSPLFWSSSPSFGHLPP